MTSIGCWSVPPMNWKRFVIREAGKQLLKSRACECNGRALWSTHTISQLVTLASQLAASGQEEVVEYGSLG
jgi:hypothetical protein